MCVVVHVSSCAEAAEGPVRVAVTRASAARRRAASGRSAVPSSGARDDGERAPVLVPGGFNAAAAQGMADAVAKAEEPLPKGDEEEEDAGEDGVGDGVADDGDARGQGDGVGGEEEASVEASEASGDMESGEKVVEEDDEDEDDAGECDRAVAYLPKTRLGAGIAVVRGDSDSDRGGGSDDEGCSCGVGVAHSKLVSSSSVFIGSALEAAACSRIVAMPAGMGGFGTGATMTGGATTTTTAAGAGACSGVSCTTGLAAGAAAVAIAPVSSCTGDSALLLLLAAV